MSQQGMGPQRHRGRVGELFPADKEREIKRGEERARLHKATNKVFADLSPSNK